MSERKRESILEQYDGFNKECGIVYGYARVSTKRQILERQIRNIMRLYPDAIIVKEQFTATVISRKEFDKLLGLLKRGDKLVFDSVSRMSRNAEEGVLLYKALFRKGIVLEFLNESHINTEVYAAAIRKCHIPKTGTNVDILLSAIEEYLMSLAESQIRLAFEQAEKEVKDLQQRTREGILTAKMEGKQIGRIKGNKYVSKKEGPAKEIILKHNKAFGGSLDDKSTMKLAGISAGTFYEYKRQIREKFLTDN